MVKQLIVPALQLSLCFCPKSINIQRFSTPLG